MRTQELNIRVKNYNHIFAKLESISPCPIIFEKIDGAYGYYCENRKGKIIAIHEGMSELQTLIVLIHEISHAVLHNSEEVKKRDKKPSSNTQELEARSIAYIVSLYLCMETSDYRYLYIESLGREDLKEFKGSLEIIKDTAEKLINAVNGADTIKKAA